MPRFVRKKKTKLSPSTNDMLFVTLSDPIKPSSFKYRTALSEQWGKIGSVQGTIDFLLTNDYEFSKKNPEVMSWNILGPELAADGFATSLGKSDNANLEEVTNTFKTSLLGLGKDKREPLQKKQKYAIYAHYIVLGKNWRHYADTKGKGGTFALDEDAGGPEVEGGLKLNLSPEEYSARLSTFLDPPAEGAAAYKHLKIVGWISDKRRDPIMKTPRDVELAKAALRLLQPSTGAGTNATTVYNHLNTATDYLQLGKLEERWKLMKTYMGMNQPPVARWSRSSATGPKCNVWCLQEMDAECLTYLEKESNIKFHGFGGRDGSKDCVVAWHSQIWKLSSGVSETINKTVEGLNIKGGPSAAVMLEKLAGGDKCIFVSVHLKSGTGISLDQRTDELSRLAAILVSMIAEDKGAPSIVIGMDANDPRGDILLRMAIQTAKETVAELKQQWGAAFEYTTEGIENQLKEKLRVLWANYDGGRSTESGDFGDGLQEYTPWLPNFDPSFGDVVPSDHRYVMADPSRKFVLQASRPLGNFNSVKNPEIDFEAAEKEEGWSAEKALEWEKESTILREQAKAEKAAKKKAEAAAAAAGATAAVDTAPQLLANGPAAPAAAPAREAALQAFAELKEAQAKAVKARAAIPRRRRLEWSREKKEHALADAKHDKAMRKFFEARERYEKLVPAAVVAGAGARAAAAATAAAARARADAAEARAAAAAATAARAPAPSPAPPPPASPASRPRRRWSPQVPEPAQVRAQEPSPLSPDWPAAKKLDEAALKKAAAAAAEDEK